ncbi:MAG: gfo/Idh/MocA family oxidoreductase, partial [Peristeroidobacter soli]
SYNTGAMLSYSLNACSAWEGYRIAFNGTRGRLEHDLVEQVYVSGANMTPGAIAADGVRIRVIPLRGAVRNIEPWEATGGHGGGDDVMLDSVFGTPAPDLYRREADERSGIYSMLVGAAANQCFETNRSVRITDLIDGLGAPDSAAMPSRATPVAMPRRVGYGLHLRGHENKKEN